MTLTTLKVAVLGAGTVGSQVIRLMEQRSDELAARAGANLEVSQVLVRNPTAKRDWQISRAKLTTDPTEAINGADIVIELIGGIEPAYTYVRQALTSGASVITGNKALLAMHGPTLYELAAQHNVDLYYEAAVAGAVPIVYGLRESMAGDRIERVMGIVNGTTNYILDQMATTGASYEQALKQAQTLGFAEADPSADVNGFDAAAKCALMASLAFHSRVSINDVEVEGITNLTAKDMAEAERCGMVIKLIAIAQRATGTGNKAGIHAEVFPALLPNTHPLATVAGAFNAVLVEAEAAGTLMFYGQGAGGAPTASAVLGDLVAAASHRVYGGNAPRESCYAALPIIPAGQVDTRYQIRLRVRDHAGVLAEVAGTFARHGVSILTVRQDETDGEEVDIVITTHTARGSDLRAVAGALAKSDVVVSVESMIRILN